MGRLSGDLSAVSISGAVARPIVRAYAVPVQYSQGGPLGEVVMEALRRAGGSATAKQIRDIVGEIAGLSAEELAAPGPPSSRTRTKIGHSVDGALQGLKRRGLVAHDGGRPARWSIVTP
jgi:hypothetical protein